MFGRSIFLLEGDDSLEDKGFFSSSLFRVIVFFKAFSSSSFYLYLLCIDNFLLKALAMIFSFGGSAFYFLSCSIFFSMAFLKLLLNESTYLYSFSSYSAFSLSLLIFFYSVLTIMFYFGSLYSFGSSTFGLS